MVTGILVTASKSEDGSYPYNTVTVVMLTESTKLLLTVIAHIRDGNSLRSWFENFSTHRSTLILYLVPASLYGLYNILSYHNLQVFDPTTYFILLQFRTLLTAFIWMALFNKKLSMEQYSKTQIINQNGATSGFEMCFAIHTPKTSALS